MSKPRIRVGVDDARQPIIRVEIVSRPGIFATFTASDYETLVAQHGPLRLYLNQSGPGQSSYVRMAQADVAGQLAVVARMVAGPTRGQIVRYRNDDRLDLRRANLAISRGNARGPTSIIDEFTGRRMLPKRKSYQAASAGLGLTA